MGKTTAKHLCFCLRCEAHCIEMYIIQHNTYIGACVATSLLAADALNIIKTLLQNFYIIVRAPLTDSFSNQNDWVFWDTVILMHAKILNNTRLCKWFHFCLNYHFSNYKMPVNFVLAVITFFKLKTVCRWGFYKLFDKSWIWKTAKGRHVNCSSALTN